jgi:hypothetical protein
MAIPTLARTRTLTIVAQDPAVRVGEKILTTPVDVPAENLAAGPRGYRVHVIDYDASTRTLYKPFKYPDDAIDPFREPTNDTVLNDPNFHAQNVYAIIMRTLARFEFALGRRVGWSFPGHQLKVAPHAFADANAFYSERDEALMFGYFPGRQDTIFSCLSHDVVAHETTHALVDGLRGRYSDPASPDQAAFHEGFADVVALLSVFSLRDVVKTVLDWQADRPTTPPEEANLIRRQDTSPEALRGSLLLGLAEQMGQELSRVRGSALRRSVELTPSADYLSPAQFPEFQEPHRRGEILVAAMMNAFLTIWTQRLSTLGFIRGEWLSRDRVAEEAAEAADYLLTMAIRALDYTPPIHLEFSDFLSALLTADYEIRPDDSKYYFRRHLLESFQRYGIPPSSSAGQMPEAGLWQPPPQAMVYDRLRFHALSRDPDEMFRFVWENRDTLKLSDDAYIRVESLRPCLRIAPDDGFPLHETVAECIQLVELEARELNTIGVHKPVGMPDNTKVTLRGGVALIFDEFGRLKFAVGTRLLNSERQTEWLQYLWDYGYFESGASLRRRFSGMHRLRSLGLHRDPYEEW